MDLIITHLSCSRISRYTVQSQVHEQQQGSVKLLFFSKDLSVL